MLVLTRIFSKNIFDPLLVESVYVGPTDTNIEGRLYCLWLPSCYQGRPSSYGRDHEASQEFAKPGHNASSKRGTSEVKGGC